MSSIVERDASVCIMSHQAFALSPVARLVSSIQKERDDFAFARRHQASALTPA